MVENGVFLNSAELFDPAKGTFVATANMLSRRVGHSATLLPNGKVLVGGGEESDEHSLASAEIYDPATNKWTATGSMLTPRIARSATVLKDGRVLVTGGGDARNLSEIYDPPSGVWHAAGNMTASRVKHAATLLPDGRVLITGGSPDSQWHPVRTAEVFDPRTNKFTAISDMELARFKIPDATAVLQNGRILIAGGAAEVEVYDNAAGKFFRAGSLDEAHFFASTTLLKDGRALITGGYTTSRGRPNGPLSSEQAWIYVP